jgi:hypothetical protein
MCNTQRGRTNKHNEVAGGGRGCCKQVVRMSQPPRELENHCQQTQDNRMSVCVCLCVFVVVQNACISACVCMFVFLNVCN